MKRLLTLAALCAALSIQISQPVLSQASGAYSIPAPVLQSLRTQILSMPYQVTNESMWYPGQGGFDFTYPYRLDKLDLPVGIGGYFDPSIFGVGLGEFGAFLGADVVTRPSID